MLDESKDHSEQPPKPPMHEHHQHGRPEDTSVGGSSEKEEVSNNILLGLLVSFACGLRAFIDGLTILQNRGALHWTGVVRLLMTSIEAYTVGHLLLRVDHIHRLKYIFAVYSYVLAFPCGILLSVVFGSVLASKTATSLLIRWLFLSASFGTSAYIIIFHMINSAFNSGQNKMKLFLLFVLGQAVSFGLVARPV